MANPQLEEGYTAIANEILEQLYKRYLSPNQWQVMLCVARKTYGYRKKLDFISTSQIAKETCLCPPVVSRVLNCLHTANMIVREGRNIGIQKDWEKWRDVPKRVQIISHAANINHMANSEANVSHAANNEKLAKLSIKISQTVNSVSHAANKSLAMRLNTKEKKETTTKETIQKKEEFRVENYPVPEWIDADLWISYMEVREKKKAVQSEQALKLILSDLTRYHEEGQDVNEILRRSIKGSWKDVYSLKDKPTGSGPPKSRPQPQRVTARTEEYPMEAYYEGLK